MGDHFPDLSDQYCIRESLSPGNSLGLGLVHTNVLFEKSHLNSIRKEKCKNPIPLINPSPEIKLITIKKVIPYLFLPKTNDILNASMMRNVGKKLNDLKKTILSKVASGRIVVVKIELFRQIY